MLVTSNVSPKVTIILTSYNHAKYIREAIESALNQTFTDFELMIWDDASTDESWEIINSYQDSRIKRFRNETNEGGTLRKAIGSGKVVSDYIAVHHSDDVWESSKLAKQVSFLDSHPEVGAVFTNALIIQEDGNPLQDASHSYSSVFEQPNRTRHEWLRFFVKHGNALCHPSVLIRKTCYEHCGLRKYGLVQLPDLDLWIRLALKYELHVLPEKLVRFRVRDNRANTSANRPDTRRRGRFEFYKILDSYKAITSFEELSLVFPEANKFFRGEKTDLLFVLGMVMLETAVFPFVQLFALGIIFDALNDPKRREVIEKYHAFNHDDFRLLTGKCDIFANEKLLSLRRDIVKLNGVVRRLAPWRITELLRYIKGFLAISCG